MIPKIIHYCWFGRNQKPKLTKRCIKSWKRYCSDYEIREWNEDTFDISSAPLYVKQAYELKKWAFVSDYVRFVVLSKYGGIYFDTDVEIIKPIDRFLNHDAFSSTEDGLHISAGVMGCVEGFHVFKKMTETYNRLLFIEENGDINTITVVKYLTNYCLKIGYVPENKYQQFCGFVIYPSEYFYPLSFPERLMKITKNTATIHWFAGSWLTREEKRVIRMKFIKARIKFMLVKLIGNEAFEKMKKIATRNR